MTTTNLANFGFRELAMAAELLTAWSKNQLPEEFDLDNVQIMMNQSSGNVFLTNENYDVVMMHDDKLQMFYSDPETGEEGFFDELSDEAKERLGL